MMEIKTNTGFTLIEVLIAMVVLAFGLLGLTGLQATGLRNNLSPYNRSQATQLAYDIADRMRANVAGAATYTTMGVADASVQNDCKPVSNIPNPSPVPVTCTVADMAQHDLFEWGQNLAVLPSGQGSVAVAGTIFTVTVNWDDNRDGCVNPGDTKAGCNTLPADDDDPRFQMRFQL